jgi:hypothetical protein
MKKITTLFLLFYTFTSFFLHGMIIENTPQSSSPDATASSTTTAPTSNTTSPTPQASAPSNQIDYGMERNTSQTSQAPLQGNSYEEMAKTNNSGNSNGLNFESTEGTKDSGSTKNEDLALIAGVAAGALALGAAGYAAKGIYDEKKKQKADASAARPETIKNLQAQLGKETDPVKKTTLQNQIDSEQRKLDKENSTKPLSDKKTSTSSTQSNTLQQSTANANDEKQSKKLMALKKKKKKLKAKKQTLEKKPGITDQNKITKIESKISSTQEKIKAAKEAQAKKAELKQKLAGATGTKAKVATAQEKIQSTSSTKEKASIAKTTAKSVAIEKAKAAKASAKSHFTQLKNQNPLRFTGK